MGTRALLRFRPDARDRLAAFVAAEAECCAFLDLELRDDPDAVVLRIDGPDGAETIVHDLAAAFGAVEE